MSAQTAACPVCEVHTESTFRVDGLDCHEEVAILERRLRGLAGVEALSADVVGQRLHVQYDAARLSASAIADAVADTGMRAWLEHEDARPVGVSPVRLALLWVSGAALTGAVAAKAAGLPGEVAAAVSAVAVLAGGVYTARRAWAALRMRVVDMHVLMTIAVLGAMAVGEWIEAGTVVFLFALAQHLETASMDRARKAIGALMSLAPADALTVRGGREVRVPLGEIGLDDLVIVRPGEKVPVDGLVAGGGSDVNQAPITGESLPVDKRPGDGVYAGTINGRGVLEVRVTRLGRDTTLSRIIHLVESAQAERAPAQAFVDRFARWYTPLVVAGALVIAVGPPLAGAPVADWIYRALVLLVIACPCALVISTPVAIVSALAGAARRGVLIKGGRHVERLAAVRAVAFDKTGTLTRGAPEVMDVTGFDGATPADVLHVAAALEARSTHPIGRAIRRYARARDITPPASEGYHMLPGLGAEGRVDGAAALAGNARLFRERGLLTPVVTAAMDRQAEDGRSSVLVARQGSVVGLIAVADRPRDAARDVVDLLRAQGLGPLVILTGDSERAASAIGRELGVDDVRAGLLPADKVEAIRRLKISAGTVAMVGDGVNDAPALAAADVGLVMGAAGSDAALEVADVALMGDELSKIPYAVRLSRATVRTIRVNVALSLVTKAVFLLLATTGHATLWMAILADTGTSLLVVANGLRLLKTT